MKQFLLLLLFCISSTIAMAQTTWIGLGADTDWNTIENWDTNLVPTAADDVIIPTGFTVTLNVAGNIKSIAVQGTSVFEMNSDLTFTEPSNFETDVTVNWILGTINGTGSTLTNLSTINLTTTNIHTIAGGTTLDNQGILNITSSGDLRINGSETILNNLVRGIIDMQANSGDITWSGSEPGVLNNVGLIKKTTSAGEARIIIPINNNNGTLQAEIGILSIQNTLGKNFTDGAYNVFTGATMDWDTVINPSGILEGTIDGDLNWNSVVNIPVGQTATFNFSVTDNFNWVLGTLSGGGTLVNTNVLKLTTTNIHTISGGTTLDNQGVLNITSSGDLRINDTGSILNNPIGGIIDMQATSGDITWSGSEPGVLNNVGLIKKTTSAGEARIIIPINNNNGTLQAEIGILSIQNTLGKNFTDGAYNVFTGATMDWDTVINPSGILEGTIDGDLNWNSVVNIPVGQTATFNFSVTDNFNWVLGTLSGGGTLVNTNVLKLTTTNIHTISGGTTLDNQGVLNITSSGDLRINDTGSILNNPIGGIIDMQATSGDITWSGSEPGVLNNVGLIKKTTSAGEARIIIPINNNNGTIQAEEGILSFQNIGKNFKDGTYNVFTDATMDWDTVINPSGILEGTIEGDLNWNNTVNVVDGIYAAFNFSETDNFNWVLGTLSGGGTLVNTNVLKLTTTNIHTISGNTTLDNQGVINITSSGDLRINDTGSILNNLIGGIIDMQATSGDITWSGVEPGVINNMGLIKRTSTTGLARIFVDLNNSGIVEVLTGELEHTGDRPFTNEVTGIVKGIGVFDLPTVANYTNDGTFAPGLSPGTLTVQGDYKSSATSVLDIELYGLIPNTEYDVLAITGTNVVFEGNVQITMGFEADEGNTFTIATVSGTIATKNLVTPIIVDYDGKRYTFDVTYPNDDEVLLTISDKLDIQVPNVITQNITIQLDASGNASITTAQIDNGSTDNCTLVPNLLYSLDVTSFTCTDLGANTVMLTVIDEANNAATLPATVTVDDSMNPTVLTQNITAQLDASGNASVTASEIDNGSNDNCSVASLSLDITAFTCADLGVNIVNLTATDQSSNSASNTAIVTVEDTINPIVVTQNITVQLDASGNTSITTSDIDNGSSDNCSVSNLSLDITAFTCANLGANIVNLTVTDQSANSALGSAIVTVEDGIDPVIACPSDFMVDSLGPFTLPNYYELGNVTASDNCAVDTVEQSPVAGTILEGGNHVISYVVTDTSGNMNNCSFTLNVNDITLSVKDFKLTEANVLIYPNPARNFINIKSNLITKGNWEIINQLGQVVKASTFESDKIKIRVNEIPTGLYFFKIEDDNLNATVTKRIVISN